MNKIIRPLSIEGRTPDYEGALPEATYELCGDLGVYVQVGNLVYRGVWDKPNPGRGKLIGSGSWHWSHFVD